jgi:hypothetical protein
MEKELSMLKVKGLFEAAEKAITKAEILAHENRGLRDAFELEKKSRKKGKKLNLCGEPSGGVEIWSPAKIARAREYQEAKEAEEVQEAEAKEARKVQREKNKFKKEAREAAAQLARDLRIANPAALKACPAKKQPAAPKPKKLLFPRQKLKHLLKHPIKVKSSGENYF